MTRLSRRARIGVVAGATLAALAAAVLAPPFAQPPTYHDFADRRAWLGVPNIANVASGFALLAVGLWGLWRLRPGRAAPRFADPLDRWPHAALFLGVALTAFGSAHYHLAPSNDTLVWDRLAMSVIFAGFTAAILTERVGRRAGILMLGPLALLACASVVYWGASEAVGRGDLRPYAFVHFFPAILAPLLIALFPSRYDRGGDYLVVLAIYGAAIVCELLDRQIYAAGGLVSGHTLKHLIAAAAPWWYLRMLTRRRILPPPST